MPVHCALYADRLETGKQFKRNVDTLSQPHMRRIHAGLNVPVLAVLELVSLLIFRSHISSLLVLPPPTNIRVRLVSGPQLKNY